MDSLDIKELEMFRQRRIRARKHKIDSYYRHRDVILEKAKALSRAKHEPDMTLRTIRTLFVEPKDPKPKREPKPKEEPKKRGRKPGKYGPYKKKEMRKEI